MTHRVNWTAEQLAEWEAQEQARQAERATADASEDARGHLYRVIDRGARQRKRLELPADFATAVVSRVREQEVDEAIERWLLRIAGLIALVCALVYAAPDLLHSPSLAHGTWQSLSSLETWLGSPWLWATVLALAAASGLDRAVYRR